MADIVIRQFHPSDIPHLMEVCLKTAYRGKDSTRFYTDPWFIGQIYVLPYLIYHPELARVIIEDGIPMGYIVGTANSEDFYTWIDYEFLPPVRERYPIDATGLSSLEKDVRTLLHKKTSSTWFPPEYPAHLHINLMRNVQRRGFGSKMIQLFLSLPDISQLDGVHLVASAKNTEAIAFYKRQGFIILKETKEAVTMGIRLNNLEGPSSQNTIS